MRIWQWVAPISKVSVATMAGNVGRSEEFLSYLNEFLANIRPDDPLPVRAPCYKVTENEIDGQILDIVHHYLNGK